MAGAGPIRWTWARRARLPSGRLIHSPSGPATDADDRCRRWRNAAVGRPTERRGQARRALVLLNRALATTKGSGPGRSDGGLIARSSAVYIDSGTSAAPGWFSARSVLERILARRSILLSVPPAWLSSISERSAAGRRSWYAARSRPGTRARTGPSAGGPRCSRWRTSAKMRGPQGGAAGIDAVSIFEATDGTDSLMFASCRQPQEHLSQQRGIRRRAYLRALRSSKVEGGQSPRRDHAAESRVAARNRRDHARAEATTCARWPSARRPARGSSRHRVEPEQPLILYNLHGDVRARSSAFPRARIGRTTGLTPAAR